jgi:prophage tail gpP-like protein
VARLYGQARTSRKTRSLMSAYQSSSTPSDEVSIVANGVQWQGWQSVNISRGIETVPACFALSGTERYPGESGTVDIQITSPRQIKIGADTIITGYVDTSERAVTAESHEIRLTGRSKLSDLVDSSGFTKTWQLQNLTLVDVATAICAPFGITVSAPDGDTAPIPSLSIVLTETGYELLEECARWLNKLVYDSPEGNLVIASLGDETHSSGIQEGVNALQWRVSLDAQEVFSSIGAIYNDTATLTDGAGDTTISYVQNAQATAANFFLPRADGTARYRPLLIVAEQGPAASNVVPRRIQWEMGRRIGRSQIVYVTVDSWRDSAGALWTPNWMVSVNLPSVKITAQTLLITNVTYIKDDQGTRAELTLMPPAAMAPMPVAPLGYDPALSVAGGDTTGAQLPPTSSGS